MSENKCRLCGKRIQDDDAFFGPDCMARYNAALLLTGTTEAEVGHLFLTGDNTVHAWLRQMRNALVAALKASEGRRRMEHIGFAKCRIESARRALEAQPERAELAEAA